MSQDPVASSLWASVRDALLLRDKLKAAGLDAREIEQGFERAVRDAWPKPAHRTQPWRYACDRCDDVGLVILYCEAGARCDGSSARTDGPRERPGKYHRLCTKGATDYRHTYGEPCVCAAGRRYLPPSSTGEDFTAATKAKPKPMTRWGR